MHGSRPDAGLRVLHCDNHVLGVVKPAGIPTVPDSSGDESLLDLAKAWVRAEFEKPGNVFLGVVHRLDRPVSGVLVFARTSKAAARLSVSLRERSAEKIYWGVGEGEAREDSGLLEQWLEKDPARNRVHAFREARATAKRALTRWRVLARRPGRTLYEFVPETGRPHQLRVCAASLGTPLLGDLKYGAREALPDASVALHARALTIAHPTLGTPLRLLAAPPALPVWEITASS
ncbi:MAG: RluA family pseudouridine synthase [Planctomycetota bacterium]